MIYAAIKKIAKKVFPGTLLKKIYLLRYLRKLKKSAADRLKPREMLKFDIHVADHCNLKCRGCEHFSTLAEETFLEPSAFEKDCERIFELTQGKIESIAILGGEPLLHPQLTAFFDISRKYFKTCSLELVTNGILLSKQTEAFWENCRKNAVGIKITVYPVKVDHDAIKTLSAKYGIPLTYWGEPGKATRWQRRPLDLRGTQNGPKSFELCYMANGCIQLVHGKLYTCAVIAYVKYFNAYFNVNLEVGKSDYIDIYEAKSIQEILEFLCKPSPFCRYCDIKNTVLQIDWKVSKKSISEWTSTELS